MASKHAPTSPRLGAHAIVIGASMAGLLAARVLSDSYDRVTVLDRDRLPDGLTENRRAVPQGRHAHGLQPGGQQAIEALLPGFREQALEGGASTLRAALDMRMNIFGNDIRRVRIDGDYAIASRPLLRGARPPAGPRDRERHGPRPGRRLRVHAHRRPRHRRPREGPRARQRGAAPARRPRRRRVGSRRQGPGVARGDGLRPARRGPHRHRRRLREPLRAHQARRPRRGPARPQRRDPRAAPRRRPRHRGGRPLELHAAGLRRRPPPADRRGRLHGVPRHGRRARRRRRDRAGRAAERHRARTPTPRACAAATRSSSASPTACSSWATRCAASTRSTARA